MYSYFFNSFCIKCVWPAVCRWSKVTENTGFLVNKRPPVPTKLYKLKNPIFMTKNLQIRRVPPYESGAERPESSTRNTRIHSVIRENFVFLLIFEKFNQEKVKDGTLFGDRCSPAPKHYRRPPATR